MFVHFFIDEFQIVESIIETCRTEKMGLNLYIFLFSKAQIFFVLYYYYSIFLSSFSHSVTIQPSEIGDNTRELPQYTYRRIWYIIMRILLNVITFFRSLFLSCSFQSCALLLIKIFYVCFLFFL